MLYPMSGFVLPWVFGWEIVGFEKNLGSTSVSADAYALYAVDWQGA